MTRQTLKNALLVQLAVIYTRYLVGGAFVFASLIKIKGHRFTQMDGTVAGHNPGYFFEMMYQSGLYWQFIGVAQCGAGLLLLTQRFALLGALAYLSIMANIFVITISYDFAGTSVITGLMLLAGLLLLAWDWNRLRVVVNRPAESETTSPLFESRLWEVVGVVLFAFTAGYRAFTDRYNMLLWMGVCVLVGVAGLLLAWRRHRKAALVAA
ncbi:small-conductance mechanosensitive channel [Hymenobacter sp. UYAg731]